MKPLTKLQRRILTAVAGHYWNSHDFNGITLHNLINAEPEARIEDFEQLISRGSLELVSTEHEVNPHIKRLPPPSLAVQVKYLTSGVEHQVCTYPSVAYARRALGARAELSKPFTRLLQCGHPQLEPHFFSLAVLDRYNMDPRYIFDFAGLDGHISIREKHYRSRKFPSRDKVLLEHFGLGRNDAGTRVVAVFLRDLHNLTAEHQRYWESYEDRGKCKVESHYWRRLVFGEWTEGISVYTALLKEISLINGLCQHLGLRSLFRNEFKESELRGFGLLSRTTKSAFENFAHVLDKVLSENLNRDFFKYQRLELDERIPSAGGYEVRAKGTISLLKDWLERKIRFQEADAAKTLVEPLKRVRDIRRGPAHKIEVDEFDASLQKEKEKLIWDVYCSISNIRVLIQTHPQARKFEALDLPESENIVVF